MHIDASAFSASAIHADKIEETHLFLDSGISELSLMLSGCGAILLRSVGETLRCSFDAPGKAIEAAAAILEAMDASDSPIPPLRVGLHIGPISLRGDAYVGDGVKVAARMAEVAEPGQIVCSPEMVWCVSEDSRWNLVPLTDVKVAGASLDGTPPHELRLEGEDDEEDEDDDMVPTVPMPSRPVLRPKQMTAKFGRVELEKASEEKRSDLVPKRVPLVPKRGTAKLRKIAAEKAAESEPDAMVVTRVHLLSNHGDMATVDSESPRFTLGRDESNDWVCMGNTASRAHAEFILNKGEIYLLDHSRHGCLVLFEGDEKVKFINDESVVLDRPAGMVCLGCRPATPNGDCISFWIEYED